MTGPAELDGEIMAAFPVRFDLPVPPSCPIEDAAAAIKHEYRISVARSDSGASNGSSSPTARKGRSMC